MTEITSPAGDEATEVRAVILMPTYNNAGTLGDIVQRAQALRLPVMIVNDGSTDGTAAWLTERERKARDASDSQLIEVHHERNLGKAAALRSGFEAARERGFTHAVTIDTDGQLDPENIPRLLERTHASPRALVLGVRDASSADYPSRSRIGRRLSNLAIQVECGAIVEDSQCGLRVYPLEIFERVRCDTERYGFEAAIITLAAWEGFAVINVPVNCRYFPGEQRVSHFQPWRDSLHGIGLHMRLLFWRLLPRSVRKRNYAHVTSEPVNMQARR